jgi:hypothetical protein
LQAGIQRIVDKFVLVGSESVYRQLFGNYVEHVVNTVVGPDAVASCLRACF